MITRNGSSFVSWYRHMSQEYAHHLMRYIEALQPVIPGFSSVRLERVGTEARALMVQFKENGRRYEIRLDELSDGQRALLALYALVHLTADQGYTLFLDEPNNYVALPELQPWLMEIADASGDSLAQVVICSHNSEVIDDLAPESGILLSREATGSTRSRRISELGLGGELPVSEMLARGWVP